jgi:hypothetical protein
VIAKFDINATRHTSLDLLSGSCLGSFSISKLGLTIETPGQASEKYQYNLKDDKTH